MSLSGKRLMSPVKVWAIVFFQPKQDPLLKTYWMLPVNTVPTATLPYKSIPALFAKVQIHGSPRKNNIWGSSFSSVSLSAVSRNTDAAQTTQEDLGDLSLESRRSPQIYLAFGTFPIYKFEGKHGMQQSQSQQWYLALVSAQELFYIFVAILYRPVESNVLSIFFLDLL